MLSSSIDYVAFMRELQSVLIEKLPEYSCVKTLENLWDTLGQREIINFWQHAEIEDSDCSIILPNFKMFTVVYHEAIKQVTESAATKTILFKKM